MIVKFEPDHLNTLDLTPEHKALAIKSVETMQALSLESLASTIIAPNNKRPLAVLGAVKAIAKQECEVFIFPSRELLKHPVVFWKEVRQELMRMRKRFNVVKAISKDTPRLRRFFGRLGFMCQGPLTREGCPEHMITWAIMGGST
jgi:hypothetical protein